MLVAPEVCCDKRKQRPQKAKIDNLWGGIFLVFFLGFSVPRWVSKMGIISEVSAFIFACASHCTGIVLFILMCTVSAGTVVFVVVRYCFY